MKKYIAFSLAAVLCLGLSLPVLAAELTGCRVSAGAVSGVPGETVTVEVRIDDNPGFTNFAIALDYDREHLTLKGIETGAEYLGGSDTAVNTAWEKEGKTYGFAVCASAAPVKGDGVLFAATFEIASGFSGTAEVSPVVEYIRSNEAVFSVFAQVRAAAVPGTVTSVLAGDVNGDGVTEYNDVMLAYQAFLGEGALTPEQMAVVDGNGNGAVEEAEVQAVYQIYIGGSR